MPNFKNMTPKCLRSFAVIAWSIACLLMGDSSLQAGPYLLVNGNFTVVKIDLTTGQSSLFGIFDDLNTQLRNVIVAPDGDVFVSMNGGNKNIAQLVESPGLSYRVPVDFTTSPSSLGPAEMASYNGNLWAATDNGRSINEYDGQTGQLIQQIKPSSTGNIRGMTIDGDNLYFAEIFQDRISKFDLTSSPPSGGIFINSPSNPDEPYELHIGHDGNLFVSSRYQTTIDEFDINTGAFIRTFVDLNDFNPTATNNDTGNYFTYSPELNCYFADFDGSKIYQFGTDGNLIATFDSPLLFGDARGIAVVVPEVGAVGLLATFAGGFSLVAIYRRDKSRLA